MTASASNLSNLWGWDYRARAEQLASWPFPLIDVHTHLIGARAAAVFAQAADTYGVGQVYTMTPLEEVDAIRQVLGDRVQFIATPDFFAQDRWYALTDGYARRLRDFRERGSRIAKFWSAPRGVDFAEQAGAPPNAFRLDTDHVQKNMAIAVDLGMIVMVHVGDPDTWFATHYADARRYGTKAEQYGPLRICLRRYPVPFIAAHLGGWPEDLGFLDQLLGEYPNLYLDTSATKWMVRALSVHEPGVLARFFTRWQDRLLFGSDIVTRDAHLLREANDAEEAKSSDAAEAFDLYASRYWSLRTLFETNFEGPSPVADPDLHLVDPQTYQPSDSPTLRGFCLPKQVLRSIYYDSARRLLDGDR